MSPSLIFFVCCWNTLVPKAEHGVSASCSGILTIILPCQTQKEESRRWKNWEDAFGNRLKTIFFYTSYAYHQSMVVLARKHDPPSHPPTHSLSKSWLRAARHIFIFYKQTAVTNDERPKKVSLWNYHCAVDSMLSKLSTKNSSEFIEPCTVQSPHIEYN
jgi:hypothetical protein